MYRVRKYYGRGSRSSYKSNVFEWARYRCEDCKIPCTSFKQLQQHLNGIKHREKGRDMHPYKKRFNESSNEAEENYFPLEHMVVLDQTEDLTNDNAASPASCDSSDSETAASASDISRSHMVILDETNDDNDHPASPASCDSSVSESAPSSPATVKMSALTLTKKKLRSEMPEDDHTASVSPLSVISSFTSFNTAPAEAEAVHGISKKSTGKKYSAKSGNMKSEESKNCHIKPIKSNQDVFQFLKTFAIANESDVAFLEKVKEMFSNALRKYEEIKLEEIFCTEAEHSSSEELAESTDGPSNHEETNSSIPQATSKNKCVIINSAPRPPANSSTPQCIIKLTSTTDNQQDSQIINQSYNSDPSSIASRSPTNIYEDIDASNKLSATDSRNYNPCSATEADLLMESEDCVAAEAACSDDDV